MTKTFPSDIDDVIAERDKNIDTIGRYDYGWHDKDTFGASAHRGLSEDVVLSLIHI